MKSQMKAICLSLGLLVAIGAAQTANYQEGKIVSIKQHEAASTMGHTDAPSKSKTAVYDMAIQSGGKTYNVVYKAHEDLDPSWAEGKTVEVQVQGKTLYLKKSAGQHPAKLSIVSSK